MIISTAKRNCIETGSVFLYQLFGYSGSGNVFFLRKHLSEDQTDEWSAVEDLPEESNWEVHECCLTPGSNHITSCVLEQNRCNKTHARTHDAYDHGRDCKSDEDWSVLWCNDTEGIGKEMDLFMFSDTVGKGLPMWLPKGTALRIRLQDFLRRIQARYDYQEVMCPPIGNKLLYVTSGHYAKYGKDAFQPIHTPEEGEEYFLKPMNCPHHCMIYKNSPRSYRDLPLRIAEFGTVCRYEQSGELHGLTRVRSFTQDDAHIFCRPDQVKDEFLRVMDIISIVFTSMGLENFEAQISLRDKENREKYIGSDENWEKAERAIVEACEEKGLKAKVEYGEAAFYGPKLDFMVKDAIGRRWQLGTIQVDYNLPERFQLEYMGSDNQKHRPVMIHRAPFGSMERFVAVLIEHTAGKFPLWLTPDQVAILPISEKFNDYADKVRMELKKYDVRALVDDRNEKIGRKIRDNEMKRIPYMLIVGEKEAENGEVAVRKQGEGDKGTMKIEEFAKNIAEEVHNMINKW